MPGAGAINRGQLQPPPVVPFTGNATLTASQSGFMVTNTGSTGLVQLTLPPIAPGIEFFAAVTVAQLFKFLAQGGTTITLGATPGVGPNQSQSNGFVQSNMIGSMLHIFAVSSTQWFAQLEGAWSIDQ